MSWMDEARRIPVSRVAPALGLRVRRRGSVVGFTCPSHGEDHSDGRPSGRIVHEGRGWKCWSCGASGDGLGLAAIVLLGREPAGPDDWESVRTWYESAELVAPPAPEPKPPSRLPAAEVASLWESAWPAFTEHRARRWLQARGLVDWHLTKLCRSLPERVAVPNWARCEGVEWHHGHTLILPCFDASGSLVGCRARWTGTSWDWLEMEWRETAAPAGRKEVNPRGAGVLAGTVYASPLGASLLARGSTMKAGDSLWDGRVVIVEGGPCWLRYAGEAFALRHQGKQAPVVFGVWSGAWPDGIAGDALASRLGGCRVIIATDADKAGEQYAGAIAETLRRQGITGQRRRLEEG